MAAITWVGGTSTDWNTDSNWSGGVKPTATDDVTFDNSSAVNCTLSANGFCKTLSVTTYAKTLNINGHILDVAGAITFTNTTGQVLNDGGGTLRQSADGDCTMAPKTLTSTGTLDLQGTGTVIGFGSSGRLFRYVIIAYSGKTTTGNVGATYQLTINGGTFTQATDYSQCGGAGTSTGLVFVSGSTWNGNQAFYYGSTLTGASETTLDLPAGIVIGGTVRFNCHNNFNVNGIIFQFLGNATFGANLYCGATNKTHIKFGSGTISVAGTFICDSGGANLVSFESSTCTFTGAAKIGNAATATTIDWGTANVTFSAGLTLAGSSVSTTVGTATITFPNTCTITTKSQPFYLVKFGTLNVAKTITIADGGWTFNRLQIQPRTTVKPLSGTTGTITNYTTGDWTGNSTYKVIVQASTTSASTLNLPAGMVMDYFSVTYMTSSVNVDCYTNVSHNTDGGNNTKFLFTAPATILPFAEEIEEEY